MPDIAAILLRKSVGALTSGRPHCSSCRRTPLVGERLHETGGGRQLCDLCVLEMPEDDRHFVRVFQGKEKARLTFADGAEVVKMLMTCYRSAEEGRTLSYPSRGIESFVPKVALGTWKP